MQRLAGYVGRALLAVVVAVVTLELALQAMAMYGAQRGVPAERPDADWVVLCVGDSHTYGAPLPEPESYPSQLQARLDEKWSDLSFSVINLGVPGMSTRMMVNRLPEWLDRYKPDVLMFWGGVNNSWNVAESENDTEVESLLFHSRVYRLFSRLRFDQKNTASENPSGDGRAQLLENALLEGESRWRVDGEVVETRRAELTPADWQPGLEQDLLEVVNQARSRDIHLSLLTYPVLADALQPVNETIKAVGEEFGIPTVDGSMQVIYARTDGEDAEDLIVDAAGPHPTGVLYRYFVDSLMAHMALYLGRWDAPNLPGEPMSESAGEKATPPAEPASS